MSTPKKPLEVSPQSILRSKEEWLAGNPFLTDEEAEKLARTPFMPITKRMIQEQIEDHDTPEL